MPAPTNDKGPALNHLRHGRTYRATTARSAMMGEYLGMETPHGDWAILLRSGGVTASIPLDQLVTVETCGGSDNA